MIRKIVVEPDDALRVTCKAVDQFGEEFQAFVEDLFETMYEAQGRGLAAPQVGDDRRVFVMDARWKDGEAAPMVLVNPEIVEAAPMRNIGEEACLSIPGKVYRVHRPVWVDMRWTSRKGVVTTERLVGQEAVIACHELDHLNGRLISDHGAEV
ncbi:peptide deformylase [Aestuariibius sp. 2305UL40-4]|uniref:peptide deformylase n=1 Tax=Aestuariibius violaceus TaxID=3234132 RepID=UPI00345E7087